MSAALPNMSPAPQASQTQSSEIRAMSKMQKLAALLIILGPESAANILKNLDVIELESVSAEMAKITMISAELQADILREFTDVAVQASTSLRGGLDFTQTSLEKAVGVFKATSIMGRVAPRHAPVAAMSQIVDLEPRQIFNLIKTEQPQTIALVCSYLPADRASEFMNLLRNDVRDQVIEKLATLAPTPVEVVERVVSVITRKLGSTPQTRAISQTGGVKSAAELLNAMEKNLSKSLLLSLEERNPELGQAIRQKMFTFEDLRSLDTTAIQKVLREVDMRDLAVSLKTASDELKAALLGAISKRAAETVNEEMSFLGAVKLKDIEGAQMRIIEVVRRLEGEGEIDVGDGKEKNDAVMA
jgi:flagellar motor switch protein FliG